MSNLPTCPTPRCVKHTAHYGTRVAEYYLPKKPDTMPDATHICQSCGGVYNGERWDHVCSQCGEHVEPGAMVGMFVPHMCKACEEKIAARDVQTGRVCGRCRKPYSRCCC